MTPSIISKSLSIVVNTISNANKSANSEKKNLDTLSKFAIGKDQLQSLKGGEDIIQEEIIGG